MKTREQTEGIPLKDLYLAGFLMAKGIPMINAIRGNGGFVFYFQSGEEADDLIRQFIEDRATVNAKAYKHALKDLKSIISGDLPIYWNRESMGQLK
jgi:hypothetical protein